MAVRTPRRAALLLRANNDSTGTLTNSLNDKRNDKLIHKHSKANMKTKMLIMQKATRLKGVLLLALAASLAAQGAAVPLNARLIARPVTPGDVTRAGLPASTEYSGGINTVGVGTPVYLEVDVNVAFPVSTITNVSFAITQEPIGSAAVITASPLGTNLGIYEPADRFNYQVAGRAVVRPDKNTGNRPYIITATIGTLTNGTTNVSFTFNAGSYVGISACSYCHGPAGQGGSAPDKLQYWTNTLHSVIFTQGINVVNGSYSVSCLKCHTVGYDTNASTLPDGGFYSVSTSEGWTFPTVLTNSNWTNLQATFPDVANLANIQCENCHGPGSEHANAFGNTNVSGWPRLAVTTNNSGDCNQCHDAPTHHIKGTEWYVSAHSGAQSTAPTIPSGAGRDQCVMCHTAIGFITRINNDISNSVASVPITNFAPTNTTYAPLNCMSCHEPHGQELPANNPHQLRKMGAVTFGDGTVVTNAGESQLCLQCHHSRNGGATNNVTQFKLGRPTWAGGSTFGPHDGPQGEIIEGVNAITYGKTFPNSAHRETVTNVCVGCHMQTVASGDPAFLQAGGHTWEMSYNVTNAPVGTNAPVVTKVDKTDVCVQCHGPMTTFNFPVEDYNGDGVIEGVQTETQHLLDQLSTLLPNTNGVVDGTVKSSLSTKTNWTTAQLNAAWNWSLVSSDGSLGVHNAPFVTGILKASIADLTGVSAQGGLPDAWVLQYFGSLTNLNASPNADPAGDGVPNWLKYALGLNPLVAGLTVPNGVVWANGSGNVGGSTNTIQIFTAADITFNTVAGTQYQIQSIDQFGGTWQNVGPAITATNTAAMSYLTPTVGTAQRFYRVIHTP
jgi:hypothetical protein